MSAFSGRVTLFDVLNISCASIICSFYMCKHRQTYQQAGWFLRPDCVPSSECPQFGSAEWCGRNISGSAHLSWTAAASPAGCQYWRSTLRSAGSCGNGKLQNVSPPSVLFESSRIVLAIHRSQRRKNWWTRILKFEFCDFWEFFEIFKKVLLGPSATDLDHYGRGQTRSE